MRKVAITFSCDTNYFPLLKGTVLSLRALGLPDGEISLHLADTGCSAADLAWAKEHGVSVVPFDIDDFYRFSPATPDNRRCAPLLYRPVAPALFPGHDIYVHIDADMWVQHRDGLMNYIDVCAAHPDKVVVTPCVDYSYASEYRKDGSHVGAMFRMYADLYGREVAEQYYGRPVLSAGMYAVHRDHPFWGTWKREMDRSYDTITSVDTDRTGSDQSTMNYLLQQDFGFIPLSAYHNYNCHVGFPYRRRSDELVRVGFPPHDPIGVVHLTCFGLHKAMYYKYGLLYDQGRYLTDEDRRTLGL